MPVSRKELELDLNRLLQPSQFRDYCPNGLQVEGKAEITKVVSGVTASLALIEAAIASQADALLVHHGYFWRGEEPVVTGMKKRRLQALLEHGVNLFAYHLPLDAHPELGNNAQLAARLEFSIDDTIGPPGDLPLVMLGKPASAMSSNELAGLLGDRLGRQALLIQGNQRPVQRLAWCTGAAQGFIDVAVAAGVDAYISGEVSEQTAHIARECGVNYYAAGHHATERYGVQAVGNYLREHFDVEHEFIDIDNPV